MCARIRSRTLFNATTWPGSLVGIMATAVNLTYTVFLFSEKCVVWQTTATGLMIHTLARSMRWEMTESDSGSYHGKAFLDLPQASVIFSPQNTLTHHPNFSGGAKGESQHGLHFALRSFAYCTPWRMMTMPTNSTDWQRKGLCWSVNTFPPRRCQNYSSCQDTLWCKHVETNITEFGNRRFIVSYSMM